WQVEWNMLRVWLVRNIADIVDSSRTGDSCDPACTASALRDASAVLQRNLQAASREPADRPQAAIALDSVQRYWRDFVAADCAAISAASDRRGQPVQSCRLWLTQARA